MDLQAVKQRRAARIFNQMSVASIAVMPFFPVLLLWIAASIVVYSAHIYNPDARVREYTRWAGYRFYGMVGSILASMSYSSILSKMVGGGVHLILILWGISVCVVIPFGIRAIIRAGRENWSIVVPAAPHGPRVNDKLQVE